MEPSGWIQMLDSMLHHIGLQMTTGSGIDLENGYIKGGNTVGIVRGLLVSFNDTDLRGQSANHTGAQPTYRFFQQCRLTRSLANSLDSGRKYVSPRNSLCYVRPTNCYAGEYPVPTLLLFLHRDDDGVHVRARVHGHDDDRDDDALRIRKFHT